MSKLDYIDQELDRLYTQLAKAPIGSDQFNKILEEIETLHKIDAQAQQTRLNDLKYSEDSARADEKLKLESDRLELDAKSAKRERILRIFETAVMVVSYLGVAVGGIWYENKGSGIVPKQSQSAMKWFRPKR